MEFIPFTDKGPAFAGKVFAEHGWKSWSDGRKLRFLRGMAKEYGMDPRMRHFVISQVIPGVQNRDYAAQAAAMLSWVQRNIRYVNEPGEIIQTPFVTMDIGYGDCDDLAVLLASMAESIKLEWRFVLGGRKRNGQPARWIEGTPKPWGVEFAHIYVMLGWPPFQPAVWQAAEPTMAVPLGHDVVMQGPTGGGGMPELGINAAAAGAGTRGQSAQGGGPGIGRYGQYGAFPGIRFKSDEEGSVARDIAVSVATSVAVTLIAEWVLRRVQRRR